MCLLTFAHLCLLDIVCRLPVPWGKPRVSHAYIRRSSCRPAPKASPGSRSPHSSAWWLHRVIAQQLGVRDCSLSLLSGLTSISRPSLAAPFSATINDTICIQAHVPLGGKFGGDLGRLHPYLGFARGHGEWMTWAPLPLLLRCLSSGCVQGCVVFADLCGPQPSPGGLA